MTEHADRRLYATWRHPEGLNRPVGLLTRRVSDQPGEMVSFRFVYLKAAEQLDGFHNLPGLPDLYRVYESDDLFPVFRNRQMPRRRPDYAEYVSELDLDVDTDPFEVMARGEGQRAQTGSRSSLTLTGLRRATSRRCSSPGESGIWTVPQKRYPESKRATS